MAVIGATGMNVFASKENTYRKYGERKAALGANIKLFRHAHARVHALPPAHPRARALWPAVRQSCSLACTAG